MKLLDWIKILTYSYLKENLYESKYKYLLKKKIADIDT